MDRVLVTGATGFIGSNLARQLVDEQKDVHIIIRPTSNTTLVADLLSKMTVYVHDGSTDQMGAIIRQANPEVVFHLASLFIARHRPEDIVSLVEANILFSTQLVDAMVTNGVFRLVNTGTSWQHFQNQGYLPVSLYAATKQACSDIFSYYCDVSPLRILTLSLFDTYGPGDPRPKLFSWLRQIAKTGEALNMTPGEQLIDLVYITDVVEAFIRAGELISHDKIDGMQEVMISSGAPIKLKDLVRIYQDITGASLNINWGGVPYREREVMVPWNNGKTLPGWSPSVSLLEGLRLMENSIGQNK
jgi:nucleoside-diphosphate-sugar epimerase